MGGPWAFDGLDSKYCRAGAAASAVRGGGPMAIEIEDVRPGRIPGFPHSEKRICGKSTASEPLNRTFFASSSFSPLFVRLIKLCISVRRGSLKRLGAGLRVRDGVMADGSLHAHLGRAAGVPNRISKPVSSRSWVVWGCKSLSKVMCRKDLKTWRNLTSFSTNRLQHSINFKRQFSNTTKETVQSFRFFVRERQNLVSDFLRATILQQEHELQLFQLVKKIRFVRYSFSLKEKKGILHEFQK